ncbi:hypothetical protein XW59_027960 [Aquamicrobium sp. LC103]|nr:hypothetical protein XW59_027960 [Aquamicrobium sp. LC103]
MQSVLLAAAAAAACLAAAMPAKAASNTDPDWPCIQRKVPELSLGQFWTGEELPESARGWSSDGDMTALVRELSARRLPLEDAQREIRDYAADISPDQLHDRMLTLVQGLFDHMNMERSQIISGIGRYARKQVELATALRKESAELDALHAKGDVEEAQLTRITDHLAFQTRIFEERVQSLTFVCEVPTLIEQRLYQLTKTISEVLAQKE